MKNIFVYLLVVSCVIFTYSSVEASEDSKRQKAVLVTGASSGIGLKITQHLTNKGYFVYAGARKDADMESLNKMANVQSIRLDVNKPDQIKAAVETIEKAGRGLYGLVNNAGVAILYPLIEVEESELDFQFNVNIYGPYRVTKAFAPMIIKEKGRITTTGSISGILSGSLFGPYSMTKHAMEAFTDSLALEMKKFDVKVSIVEPGNYESKIGDKLFKRMKAKHNNFEHSLYKPEFERMASYFDRSKVGSQKDPQAVAEAVEHALFNENPKVRYLVVPNERQAKITIAKAMQEMLQLNHGQEYTYSRDELVKMLDEGLEKLGKN